MAGGGGWGDPLARDPAAVADDVANEKVSVEAARELYGVVIGADGSRGRRRRRPPYETERRGDVIGKADAVVIGGGIMGASTAHFLTKLGFGDVALVEKRKICGGSTQYSAAHVRQHYSNEVGIRLAVRGAAMFNNAEEELGGPVGFHQIGYMLFAPPEEAQALRDTVAVQRSFGVETSTLEPDEVVQPLAAAPARRASALACHEPTSGFADPVLTVETLVRSAQRDGLHVYEGCEVLGISTANGRVTGVVTGDGEIATGVVVNACGPWSDRIGRMAGVDYPLDVQPRARGDLRRARGLRGLPGHLGRAAGALLPALRRRQDPRRRRLAEAEGAGRPRDLRRRHRRRAREQDGAAAPEPRARRSAPTLTQPNYGGAFVTGYSGVYDITEDWYPIVGEEELGGYYSCFGGSGHGFKIGPAIGEALADTIAGRQPTIDISSLSGRALLGGPHVRLGVGAGEPRMRPLDPDHRSR